MKYIILLLSIITSRLTSYAQTETFASKAAGSAFEEKFNSNDNNGIFALFDETMKAALPIDKTTEFFTQLKTRAGNIINREFIAYESGTYAAYKTRFVKVIFALRISVNKDGKINGLFVGPYTDTLAPKPARNTANLILPFKGEWTVLWGGDTKDINYHVENTSQKNAFDIVVTDEKGISHSGSGRRNTDYYAFGKEIFAPCDGEVVLVVDGVKDNQPGKLNPVYVPGNTVIIKIGNDQYAFFAHFKQGSIAVRQGRPVKRGELLGLCGNTGNSSEPHLHFHLQNMEDLQDATGIKCYFDTIMVNGQLKTDYSPVQKDKISNIKSV